MLVLSRKQGEKIVIGGEIEVVVVKTKGGRVQLAIAAPPHIAIYRGELLAAVGERRYPLSPVLVSSPRPLTHRTKE